MAAVITLYDTSIAVVVHSIVRRKKPRCRQGGAPQELSLTRQQRASSQQQACIPKSHARDFKLSRVRSRWRSRPCSALQDNGAKVRQLRLFSRKRQPPRGWRLETA